MATFAGRTQLERDLPLRGTTARLYVSCGKSDDYLELAFPDDPHLVSAIWEQLEGIDPRPDESGVDVRFHEGPPATLSLLALRLASDERPLSRDQRVKSLLLQLARVVPDLEFGDLLPEHVAQSPAASPHPDALPEGEGEPSTQHPALSPSSGTQHPALSPSSSTQNSDADDLLARATDQARKGRSHKAVRLLEEILRNHPTNGPAWKLREEIRLLERREKKRQRDPRNPQTNLEVGFSYLIVERNQDAAEALRASIRLDSEVYLSHLLLGIALHREGERDGAREAYQRAARLQPESNGVCVDLLQALERGDPPMPLAESNRPGYVRAQPQDTHSWARAV